jgi:hypothetical protein
LTITTFRESGKADRGESCMHGQRIDAHGQLSLQELAYRNLEVNLIFLHNKYRTNRLTMLKTDIFQVDIDRGGELPSASAQ